MKSRKGFTLVEILIVVVILGILAAIVIPQFSQASTEARESNMVSNLQSIRAQIELYKMQHLDVLPANAAALTTALTTTTDINGAAWAAGAGTAFGPYMRDIPINPFNQLMDANRNGTVTVVATGARAAAANATSWTYDTTNGDFYADDTLLSPDTTPHNAY